MKTSFYLLLLNLVFVISSCDVIDPPFEEEGQTNNTPATLADKKVLLEEYTGHLCGLCPPAASFALELADIMNGRVILLNVHAGGLAIPNDENTFSKFTTDFRTEVGEELNRRFDIIGNPSFLINRKLTDGTRRDVLFTGGSAIDEEVRKVIENEKSLLTIEMLADYNAPSRRIDLNLEIKYLDNSSVDDKVSAYIVEDSVVDWQTYFNHDPVDVEDYVHNNILRASFNSTFGDVLSTSPIQAGTKFNRTFNFTIPNDKSWRVEKLRIIAFVHDGESLQIKQVEQVQLLP